MKLRTLSAIAFAFAILGNSSSLCQQSQAEAAVRFEVASIKPGKADLVGSSGMSAGPPGGIYKLTNMPLREWVTTAFSIRNYSLVAPGWLQNTRYDLEARLPNEPVDRKTQSEMLRTLLVERFGLKWHEETQLISGFELVLDGKLLVQETSALDRLKGHASGSGPTLINGKNMPISELAEKLGNVLGRPVVDATKLTGGYDISLRWRPSDETKLAEQRKYAVQSGYNIDALPDSPFTAIREQLGLRLQSAKVKNKIYVVDSISPQPTAN